MMHGIDVSTALFHRARRLSWQVIALMIFIISIMAAGAQYLHFNGSYKTFFEKTDPLLVEFESMEKSFARDDSIVIVAVPKKGNIFTPDALGQIREITDLAWQTPYSTRVDSLTNYQYTSVEEDDLVVDNLLPDEAIIDAAAINYVRDVSLKEPAILNKLVAESGSVAVINIAIHLPENEDPNITTKNAALHAKAMTDAMSEKYGTMDFYHTGIIPLNYSLIAEAEKDGQTLIPLMLIAILVLLSMMLRSVSGTLMTLSLIILTLAATMGIGGWLGYYLGSATVNVPVIVMTLVIADCVHVIASAQFARRSGFDKNAAVFEAMKLNVMPIFVTSATTAAGFLTLRFSDSPPLVDFGELSAIGIMIAFVLSVTLLPAMMIVFPFKVKEESANSEALTKFADVIIKNHRVIFPVGILVIAGFAILLPKNIVNDDVVKYFAKDTEFRIASDTQEEHISGLSVLSWVIDTQEEGGVYNPELMRFTDEFRGWLLQQSEVAHVTALADTVKRLNKNLHQNDESQHKIPDDQEMLSQAILLYELSLPYGLGLNNLVNMDKSATRLLVSTWNLGSADYLALEEKGRGWVQSNYPEMANKVSMTGATIMFARVGQENMISMLKSLALALFLISGILCFALGSVRLGLISLLPNIAPAIVGFGIWYLYSGEIDMTLSIVASMSLGLVVDDAVHFLTKYKNARKKGMDAEEAIRYAFGSVGVALFVTTVVLAVGFSVLAMSQFNINANMGMLTAVIISVALIIDLTLLPAFLLLVDRNQERYSGEEETGKVDQYQDDADSGASIPAATTVAASMMIDTADHQAT